MIRGLGIDTVDLARFRAVMQRRPQLINRLFTDGERQYANSSADPIPRLAARFAAKEAGMKALGIGIGQCRFNEIEIGKDVSGAPVISFAGQAQRVFVERGGAASHVSITHTDTVASAIVIIE